jgi:hypothetical protein
MSIPKSELNLNVSAMQAPVQANADMKKRLILLQGYLVQKKKEVHAFFKSLHAKQKGKE